MNLANVNQTKQGGVTLRSWSRQLYPGAITVSVAESDYRATLRDLTPAFGTHGVNPHPLATVTGPAIAPVPSDSADARIRKVMLRLDGLHGFRKAVQARSTGARKLDAALAVEAAERNDTTRGRIVERKLRKALADASPRTTFQRSLERMALMGKLSRKARSCESCNGSGEDSEYPGMAVPCAECLGSGRGAILPKRNRLDGFYDTRRFRPVGDGCVCCPTLPMRDTFAEMIAADHARAVRYSVSPKRRGRPVKAANRARCANRMHPWNEDSTRKWCPVCGTQRLKKLTK